MTIFGIGPKIGLLSVIYAALIIFVNKTYFPNLKILIVPKQVLLSVGIALIIIGALVYLFSVKRLTKAFGKGRLETEGIYAYIRHPLYSSWIIFIVPGILLIYGRWLPLTLPIFMYIVFKILIKEEEKFLEEKFGKEYLAYNKKTGSIFPKFKAEKKE